jgi:hypothetical protein
VTVVHESQHAGAQFALGQYGLGWHYVILRGSP